MRALRLASLKLSSISILKSSLRIGMDLSSGVRTAL